jgi:hypothetical protein
MLNSATEITAPAAGQHGSYSAESRVNDFQLYDGGLQYRERHAAMFGHVQLDSVSDSVSVLQYRAQDAELSAPTSAPGSLYQADSSLNEEFGDYDNGLTYGREKPVSVGWSWPTRFGAAYAQIYESWDSIPTADLPTDGLIYNTRLEARFSRLGLYNVNRVYVPMINAGDVSDGTLESHGVYEYPRMTLAESMTLYGRTVYWGVEVATKGSLLSANQFINGGTNNSSIRPMNGIFVCEKWTLLSETGWTAV